jgi:homocysteine S-methyltransferase
LCCSSGDPRRCGDYPDATAVPEVDSIGLANVVSSLNGGSDIGGQPIGSPDGVFTSVWP